MFSVSKFSDGKLMKAGGRAGRDLTILAVLASPFAIMCAIYWLLLDGSAAPGYAGFVMIITSIISAFAAGLWLLARAAKRGNPLAPAILAVAISCVAVCCLFLYAFNCREWGRLLSLAVFGCIIFAMSRDRQILLELKKRNLWNSCFGPKKPTRTLCKIGGVLIGLGVGSMIILNLMLAGGGHFARERTCGAFGRMLSNAEKPMMNAIQRLPEDWSPERFAAALKLVGQLEQEIRALEEMKPTEEFQKNVLAPYKKAVSQWRLGLELWESTKDAQNFLQAAARGDRFRREAFDQFFRLYPEQRPKS